MSGWRSWGVPFAPDYVIDDHQEVIDAFPGVRIAPPSYPVEKDRELWRVYDAIQEYVASLPEAAD